MMFAKYMTKSESSDDNLLLRYYNAMFDQHSELPLTCDGDNHRSEPSHPPHIESLVDKQRVSCPVEYCNSSFSARKSLWRHMLIIHKLLRDQTQASDEEVQRGRDIREGKHNHLATSRRDQQAGVSTDGYEFQLSRAFDKSPIVVPYMISEHRRNGYDDDRGIGHGTAYCIDHGTDDGVGDGYLPLKTGVSLEMSRIVESTLPEDTKVFLYAQTLCKYIKSLPDDVQGNIKSTQELRVVKEEDVNKCKKKRLAPSTRKQKNKQLSTMKVGRSPCQTKSFSWVRL
jgi:hypothetical protein